MDDRWCLVHATHVTPAETRRVAASGAVVGLCPITESNLGDGIFPAAAYLEGGGSFGVGTDSNIRISLAEELRTLEYSQRLALQRRNVMASSGSTGLAALRGAVQGGTRALEASGLRSGIAQGRPANLVALDLSAAPWLRVDQIVDQFVFADGVRVDVVWARGKRLVEHGRHVRREAISTRFRSAMADLTTADRT